MSLTIAVSTRDTEFCHRDSQDETNTWFGDMGGTYSLCVCVSLCVFQGVLVICRYINSLQESS